MPRPFVSRKRPRKNSAKRKRTTDQIEWGRSDGLDEGDDKNKRDRHSIKRSLRPDG